MTKTPGVISHWLPLAVATIGLCGLVYVTVHQNYRQSLNDPQIQIAEDGAAALAAGKQPAEIVNRGSLIDAGKSLAPFIAVYDAKGTTLEASGLVNGKPPKPPVGVFDHAKQWGENRVTWQPDPTTRIALVVVPVNDSRGYFVASGRNMREVEARTDKLTQMISLALVTILIATFILELFGDYARKQAMKQAKNA